MSLICPCIFSYAISTVTATHAVIISSPPTFIFIILTAETHIVHERNTVITSDRGLGSAAETILVTVTANGTSSTFIARPARLGTAC